MVRGKKVYLSSLERENLEQLRQWRNLPELRKYFREYKEIAKENQSKWYENRVLNNNEQVDFEIHDNETGKLIGHCGLYYIEWLHSYAEFGIYIGDDDFRGGGYGSDTLRALIGYGFNDLNLNKIWCEVYDNNEALEMYKHVGFVYEGKMRQNYFNEGRYWDSHILSMLRDEYYEKYK